MKVLFDTDVVLDILLKREGFGRSAMALARVGQPWFSTLSLANACYVLGRSKRSLIVGPLEFIRAKFELASLSGTTVSRAVELAYEDFEDALQMATAELEAIPYLVTRNRKHFKPSPLVQTLSVDELLALTDA